MLYRLAQEQKANGGAFKPAKYFSIDRVFRNEAVDRTHLAEFHQIEGALRQDVLGVCGNDRLRFPECQGVISSNPKAPFTPSL